MNAVISLIRDRRAAAAAEMALVMPLLILIMFASFEMGNFFWDAHIADKAVRDGARFAARQSFADMPCGGTPTNLLAIQELTRTGQTNGGIPPRIYGWATGHVTVTVTCDTANSYSNAGIYQGLTGGSRRVTVAAAIPYPSLFKFVGINTTGMTINAQSEAAVMGI